MCVCVCVTHKFWPHSKVLSIPLSLNKMTIMQELRLIEDMPASAKLYIELSNFSLWKNKKHTYTMHEIEQCVALLFHKISEHDFHEKANCKQET